MVEDSVCVCIMVVVVVVVVVVVGSVRGPFAAAIAPITLKIDVETSETPDSCQNTRQPVWTPLSESRFSWWLYGSIS